jgi:hypothetical protein
LSALLADVESVQQKLRMPPPAIVLLASLLHGLPRRWGEVRGGELVGALLLRALQTQTAEQLGEAVAEYRETPTFEVLPEASSEKGPFRIPARGDLRL